MPPTSTSVIEQTIAQDAGAGHQEEGEEGGVVLPPTEFRLIIDKTANFVARSGPEFETKIRQSAPDNPKFQFLNPSNPYHSYYRAKIAEIQKEFPSVDGQQQQQPAPADTTTSTSQQQVSDTTIPTAVAAATAAAEEAQPGATIEKAASLMVKPAKEKPTVDPVPSIYHLTVPVDMTAYHLDFIKLMALFVARNGRQFMSAIAARERYNPEFEFLKSHHPHYPFFTQLIEIYSKILTQPLDIVEKLAKEMDNRLTILDRCYAKAEWDQSEEEQQREHMAAENEERIAWQSIDWHDFVVVETIDFKEDEELPTPSQPIVDEVELQPYKIPQPGGMLLPPEQLQQQPTMMMVPPPPPPVDVVMEMEMDMDMEEDEDDLTSARIVKSYKKPTAAAAAPTAASTAAATASQQSEQFVKDPITGQLVPLSRASEHLRIQLLDPRWKEQQEKERAKYRTTSLASGEEFINSLDAFTRYRTDIFGENEVGIGETLEKEREKKSAKPDYAIWDGHMASIPATTMAAQKGMSIEEQIAALGPKETATKQFGPQLPEHAGSSTQPPMAPPADFASQAPHQMMPPTGQEGYMYPPNIHAPAAPAQMFGSYPQWPYWMYPSMMQPQYGVDPNAQPAVNPSLLPPPVPPIEEPPAKRPRQE